MKRPGDMRVMHVIASLSGYGAENFVAGLVPALAARGAEVAVLTVYPTNDKAVASDFKGVRLMCAGRHRRMEIRFFPRMVRAIRSFRPTIVHTHMHNGKYWGRLAAVAAGVPRIVHTEHDPNFKRPSVERVVDAALARATASFIAFSEGHRRRLSRADRIPLSRIAVIPNGIEHRPIDPRARERGRTVLGLDPQHCALLMIGRLEAQKNHELALQAFAHLPGDIASKTKLFIAGDGHLRDHLRMTSETLGIAERVVFLGFRSDGPDLLAACDAMFMTSHTEAMPIALIEAMGAGAPIVSTPWLGADEMLDGGQLGEIAADYAPETVARSVATVLRDPARSRTRGQAAREYALTRYDLGNAADLHLDLYGSLLSEIAR
ncbi:MAG TPA: glycosyltransferase family 4 protein [Candidatus Binatus sp.]|nr:glycosyltransferase family 4 protein [Candidatus Binatus sp.]